jgi:hypothetical protein
MHYQLFTIDINPFKYDCGLFLKETFKNISSNEKKTYQKGETTFFF